MKRLTSCLLTFAVLGLSNGMNIARADDSSNGAAVKAAESWLALVDSGKYSESGDDAAQIFKSHVTKDQWKSALTTVRSPLGQVGSRKLKNSTYTKSLPGAPDGEYVVIQFETTFEKKQSSVETITPTKDNDGQWRVSGYYIKRGFMKGVAGAILQCESRCSSVGGGVLTGDSDLQLEDRRSENGSHFGLRWQAQRDTALDC